MLARLRKFPTRRAGQAKGLLPKMPEFHAVKAESPPAIDGDLNDPVWKQAPELDGFTQQQPESGAKPSMATTVRFAYDANFLYVAVHCVDPEPAEVSNKLTRRDRIIESDYLYVEIDSRGDKKSAYGFGVYPTNVQADWNRTGDYFQDMDFDAVWRSGTKRTDQGWDAELAIPFSVLRFKAGPEVAFRVEVARYISRKGETDELVLQPPEEQGALLRMAELTGMHELSTGTGLELRPFVLGKFDSRYSPGVGYDPPSGHGFAASAGGDVTWHPGSNLTLDATVLPDFGQVEADQVVLNLSTFEIFFPEKRPFFLSGADLFTLHDQMGSPTTTQLFYSRRVGRPPDYALYGPGERLLEQPLTDDILGAVKVTGKATDKLTVALLDGVSNRAFATIGEADGSQIHEQVAPLANFGVARLRYEVGGGLTLGLTGTGVTRRDRGELNGPYGCPETQDGDYPVADDHGRCTADAYTGGLDATWSSESGTYVAMASLLASHRVGGPELDEPDGTTIKSGDSGYGGMAQFAKAGGNWLYSIGYEGYSPKLDLNEAGYLRQQNLHYVQASGDYRTTKPWGPTLNTDLNVFANGRESTQGVNLGRHFQIGEGIYWKNFWGTYAELDFDPAHDDNRELRDGSPYERDWGVGGVFVFHTDSRKMFSGFVFNYVGKLHQGVEYTEQVGVTFRPSDALELTANPQLDWTDGDPRWYGTYGDITTPHAYEIANLNAKSTSVVVRGTYTFTPLLTLQAYAQLFFATEHYGPFFEVQEGPGIHPVSLNDLRPVPPPDPAYSPDGKSSTLNVNVLLRWEYLPGSVAYLVYTRAQTNADLSPALSYNNPDWASLHKGPYDDVLMLKVSYYFGG